MAKVSGAAMVGDKKAAPELFDVERDNVFAKVYLQRCRMDASMSGSAGEGGPTVADWEEPDWEAPAPAGWWQVIHRPCVWAWAWERGTPCPLMEDISQLHREGEVLAMVEGRRDDIHDTDWLRLRDEGSFGAQWIPIDGAKMGLGVYDFSLFLRPLPTGAGPPPAQARAAHQRAVQQRQTVRSKVQEVLGIAAGGQQEGAQQSKPTPWPDQYATIVGTATRAHASTLARELLLRPESTGPHRSDDDFARRLLRDGYAVASDILPRDGPYSLSCFVKEMGELTKNTNLHQAPQQTEGQRGDRIVWVDEELATERYGVPAVRAAVGLLKGVADALSPALSRHHADRRGARDPAHLSPLLPPASDEAVLTVPSRAMAAIYPGRGTRYIPHTDNKYRRGLGSRANARELTAILYANPPDWEVERDGGALRLWPHSEHSEECPPEEGWGGGSRRPVTIAPLGGRLVVFFSALWHEVTSAHRERRALTLWVLRPDEACLGPGAAAGRRPATPGTAASPQPTAAGAAAAATAPAAAAAAPVASRGKPVEVARRPATGSVWTVVGGSASGGITVRMKQSLTSEELGRLAPGARLQQLSPEMGGRLEYIKLEGDGPEQGWVSLSLKGKPLLRRE